ncbi:hypothetical protein [Streptomyces sp. NBC_00259]|uniref:hypothetical protein n=1 Tax=Streptomyces sp. NBC_00259 TaxID=2903643 RepID=UPI002E2B8700|nr:hypothetical protein [Streptomyces sp. NBC_00259]
MFTTTLFMAINHLQSTTKTGGTGRHRGRRADEPLLASLHLHGHGRHRRMLMSDLQESAASS